MFIKAVILLMTLACTMRLGYCCGWLDLNSCPQNLTTPALGLYFMHMRKAGGSAILTIFKTWLVHQGCLSQSDATLSGLFTFGYKRGKPIYMNKKLIRKNAIPSICKYVDIKCNEYACTSGKSLSTLNSLKRGDVSSNGRHLTFLINLREPIERIGSQAFYYGGFGKGVLGDITKRICGRRIHTCNKQRPADCRCLRNATVIAEIELRGNEEIWFDWINEGISVDSNGDKYQSNYYLKRLCSMTSSDSRLTSAQKCIQNPSHCGNGGLDTLEKMGQLRHCPPGENGGDLFDNSSALETSKTLLRDYFEIIITEYFGHSGVTSDIFQRVFFDPTFNVLEAPRVNGGVFVASSGDPQLPSPSRYRSFMPKSVIDFLEKDNAGDIELYKYAVDLFETRHSEKLSKR